MILLLTALVLVQMPEVPPVKVPTLVRVGATFEAFIPEGWALEQTTRQDFNGDGKPDALLLLRMKNPHNVLANAGLGEARFDTNPRLLFAVLAEGKAYRLAFSNMALIPRHDSPTREDPFTSLESITGGFDVNLQSLANAGSWWMGNTKFRFRFQNGCFRLIGFDSTSTHRASHESDSTSANYLTGAVIHTHVASEEAKPELQHQRLKSTKPLCIENIGDGFEFQPELGG